MITPATKAPLYGLILAALVLTGGCMMKKDPPTTADYPVADAVAILRDASGGERGRVDINVATGTIRGTVVARGLNAGKYGMHIHAIGKCNGAGFAGAGAHWNPAGRQHGLENTAGSHAGDLPNMEIAPGEIGLQTFSVVNIAVDGEGGLFDADGASLIVHAAADDMKTDPSGNSGARVLCGVITRTKR